MAPQLTQKVVNYCTKQQSVSDLVSKEPSRSPASAAKELFGRDSAAIGDEHSSKQSDSSGGSGGASPTSSNVASPTGPTDEELERALKCGNFGSCRPSDLFLRIWHDALVTLNRDPLAGVVSPSLMGTTGVMPLSLIGVVEDVCRHMSNLIVRAEKEVFLATNYWSISGATTLITDAIHELNRRAGERGQKIVFKILYDRGSMKSAYKNHFNVQPSQYTVGQIKIPDPKDIPNIDLEVMNYHRPVLGTFHCKFMIVDRRYGVLSSNNIQENDNLEFMSHFEGPIVDSLYDTALISWSNAMKPPLPQLQSPASSVEPPTFQDASFRDLFDENGSLRINGAPLSTMPEENRLPLHAPHDHHYDDHIAAQILRMRSTLQNSATETHMDRVAQHLSRATKSDKKATVSDPSQASEYFNPFIPHPPHDPFPIALVNRKPAGKPTNSSKTVPQDAAWLSALRNARRKVFIQTPDLNAKPLLPEIIKAVKRGVEVEYWVCLGYNDAGELLPGQGGTNEMISNQLFKELKSETEETQSLLRVGWYVAKDQNRPIHKKEMGRSCHIKIMIVDDQVAIQGNGNQDTQSWFHSQEINIMIDSKIICEQWRDALHRNQNTHKYGMGSREDGIWRDKDGNMAPQSIGANPGHFSWAKGIVGAVQRVRGVGGF